MIALLIHTISALGFAYILGHAVVTRDLRTWLAGPVDYRCESCGITFAEAQSATISTHETTCPNGHFVAVPIISWRNFTIALVECPACLGAWLGLVTGLVCAIWIPLPYRWAWPFILALYTCGSNLLLGKLTRIME